MTGNDPAALELTGVNVSLGGRPVLREVDLRVRPGELVALAGPNGAGKTTLLRVALGLQVPSEGTARLFGTPVRELAVRQRARRVAWVPQEEALRDNVSVRTYVLYGRFAHLGTFDPEGAEDLRKAEKALAAAGLTDRADDGILEVSGGERQRLVLARAIAQDAPLLLLDEPTAHLDIGHQLDLLDRVRLQVRNRGVGVLAAIHDLSLAARFADRIIVLSRGRIVAEGPPVRVLSGALLRSVWGVAAEVRTDPRSGIPYLLPRLAPDPSTDPSSAAGWGPVHVLGGGGAAAPWMRTLVDAGYRVTAGALHLLDTDAETAESLGIETTLEIPFAPLGDEVRARHRGQITAARALVVTPFATGPSNLGNLEDLAAVTPGTPVYLVGTESPETLDFTGGRATRLRTALAIQGAELIPDAPTLLRRLGERRRGHPGPSALPDAPASLGSR